MSHKCGPNCYRKRGKRSDCPYCARSDKSRSGGRIRLIVKRDTYKTGTADVVQ